MAIRTDGVRMSPAFLLFGAAMVVFAALSVFSLLQRSV